MKTLLYSLIAIFAFVISPAAAFADPGNTWDKVISGNRFVILKAFNDEAVLDKETGRVWERSPDAGGHDWFGALAHCYARQVGGRKGWRLATIEELASLVDTSQPAPRLPADHPFIVQSFFYWSATTNALDTSEAWGVGFNLGNVFPGGKTALSLVWCVRGGQGIDGVQ